jgi:hypothetical protein
VTIQSGNAVDDAMEGGEGWSLAIAIPGANTTSVANTKRQVGDTMAKKVTGVRSIELGVRDLQHWVVAFQI